MIESVAAFLVGCIFVSIICAWCFISYKNILVMKSKDKTAEYINGHFYYIVPEEEYRK
jgi:hypothetical protein